MHRMPAVPAVKLRAGTSRGAAWRSGLIALAGLLLAACQTSGPQMAAIGGSNQQLPGLIRAPLSLEVTMPDGAHETLEAFVTRPSAPGRYPVALITHGTSKGAYNRTLTPNRYAATAITFARRGYAAVMVLRRGYGHSTGRDEIAGVSCDNPDHQRAGEVARTDLLAALEAVRRQPWASPDKAVLLGSSTGGWAVLAAAAVNPPGVQAVLDFAGGRGASWPQVCGKKSLMEAAAAFGQTARTPVLWIYAENDKEFPPVLAREMFSHYQATGGAGELFITAANGGNGHFIMTSAPTLWWPRVGEFLTAHGLPSEEVIKPQTAERMPAPASLSDRGERSFKRYLASQSYEKAFASDGEKSWGWGGGYRTQQEAAQAALSLCRLSSSHCILYAVGDRIVLPEP
ncbi:dienelactone hydrolase family protein [Inquilinus limosus]|uniref:alpha/beta hydrolase family protein n=1 Tax=Inquilinus limosus TaxID=171674 RepID=UPI003F177114